MKKINPRRVTLALVDTISVIISCFLAILIMKGLDWSISLRSYIPRILIYTAVMSISLISCGVYKNIWKYAQVKDFAKCFLALGIGHLVSSGIFITYKYTEGIPYSRTFVTIALFIATFAIIILRTGYSWLYSFHVRTSRNISSQKRTLIVGAGNAAKRMLDEIHDSESEFYPVCLVDDDPLKLRGFIRGVRVEGTIEDIPKLCEKNAVDIILIAIPSCSAEQKKRIIDTASKTDCEIKALPYLRDIFDVDKLVEQAHTLNMEDLLGRDVINFDNEQVENLIQGRICMVTGGGGSIGSELCRQIAKYNPEKLVIVDIYENNAYEIQQELIRNYGDKLDLSVEIASVRDYQKIDLLFSTYKPQLVFHAAAHKHVPLMETNPEEAVKNNIVGTYNVSTLADLYKVERFVLISTDKAVNPTNVMGATKRCCEMIVQEMAQNAKTTKFITVRFGNVLGSNGSVIPLFEKQIAKGGPVTVTHPDIIRYFMTIPEAVSLILQAASHAEGGEIFVLDMGEPVKILSLAENIIKLHGKRPYKDIKIEFTGLRPGEKLYEELLMDEEGLRETENKKIFIGKQISVDETALMHDLELIRRMANTNDKEAVLSLLKKMVPTFNHKENKK